MNKEALRKLIEEIVDKHKSTERRQSGLPSGRFGSSYYDFTYLNPSNAIEAMEELATRIAALDDGDGPKEYYISIPVTKFGDLPTPMEAVVVFFKNRKEPWVAYREIDDIWFFENGESCKTPTHWLKKIKK